MKKHVRIAALQCNFQSREQTLSMTDFWASKGFNTEQLLHTHADLYSAIYDPERHHDLMKEYLERSRKNGVDTIVYMNVHILGPSLKDHFEDWCVRKADGSKPMLYGSYPGSCLNSGWRDYFFKCIESLGEFQIQGLFFDGPQYILCHCPHCQKLFMEKFGHSMDDAAPAELADFVRDSTLSFKKALREKVKSVNPNWMMYFNEGLFAGIHDSKLMQENLATDDMVGIEGGFFFYEEPKTQPYWYCTFCAKLAEASSNGKPTVIFFACDHKPWGWFLHTPTELRVCYADAIGNGASVWLGIHSTPENFNTASGDAVMDMVHYDKEHDGCYQNTKSLAQTAVLYSFDSASKLSNAIGMNDLYGSGHAESAYLGNYREATNGAFAVLEHLNIPYDIVTDITPEDSLKYKVILAPEASLLNDATLNALKKFVEQGGILIADGEFAKYDGKGKLRGEESVSLVGGTLKGDAFNQKTCNYMSLKWEGFEADNAYGYQPSPSWMIEVEPKDGSVPVAKIPTPLVGCYSARPGEPTICTGVRHRIGAGEVCYVAGNLFEFYNGFQIAAVRRWFKAVMDSRPQDYALLDGQAGLSVTVRSTEDGNALVHITNHIGAIRPLDGVPSVSGTTLKTPECWNSAEVLLGQGSVAMEKAGLFKLPPLGDVTVILLRK